VYKANEEADHVYFVAKGEFELQKKLAQPMPKLRLSAYILDVLESVGENAELDCNGNKIYNNTSGNILADKLPEIKDFPYSLKLS
jgi:CRP-like cAMP-binding protein